MARGRRYLATLTARSARFLDGFAAVPQERPRRKVLLGRPVDSQQPNLLARDPLHLKGYCSAPRRGGRADLPVAEILKHERLLQARGHRNARTSRLANTEARRILAAYRITTPCTGAEAGAGPGKTTTRVPRFTRPYRSSMSPLVRRMHPEDTNDPIVEGWFVP